MTKFAAKDARSAAADIRNGHWPKLLVKDVSATELVIEATQLQKVRGMNEWHARAGGNWMLVLERVY